MRFSVIQTCSNDDLAGNLAFAEKAIGRASAAGAEFVALPENFAYMRREGGTFPCVQGPDGDIVRFLADQSGRHGVWLLGGTFPERIEGSQRVYNTSTLFDPNGREVARYRKMHLFDVALGPDGTDVYRESEHFAPGEEVVVATTPWGGLGMSICYDLRFPELYRRHSAAGATILGVPSAFTPETGKDHWSVLLRARAIENQAFVIAPAQCGRHSPDRASYGRSVIVDPWGVVLAQAADAPGVITADCDFEALDRVRAAIPALANRRLI